MTKKSLYILILVILAIIGLIVVELTKKGEDKEETKLSFTSSVSELA